MGGLEQLRLLYLPKTFRPRGVFDVAAGERVTCVLYGKNLSRPVDLDVDGGGALYYLKRGTGASSGAVYRIEYTGG